MTPTVRQMVPWKTRAALAHGKLDLQPAVVTRPEVAAVSMVILGSSYSVCGAGLSPDGNSAVDEGTSVVRARGFPRPSVFLPGLLWVLWPLGWQCVLPEWQAYLEYQRGAIFMGQYWRLWTGHFIHLSWNHAALNALGMFFIYCLFHAELRTVRMMSLVCLLPGCVGGILLGGFGSLHDYLGMSGVLHGLLLYFLLNTCHYPLALRTGVLVILLVKVLWEQSGFYNAQELAHFIGGPVATQAHLAGVIGSMMLLGSERIYQRIRLSCCGDR